MENNFPEKSFFVQPNTNLVYTKLKLPLPNFWPKKIKASWSSPHPYIDFLSQVSTSPPCVNSIFSLHTNETLVFEDSSEHFSMRRHSCTKQHILLLTINKRNPPISPLRPWLREPDRTRQLDQSNRTRNRSAKQTGKNRSNPVEPTDSVNPAHPRLDRVFPGCFKNQSFFSSCKVFGHNLTLS